MNRTVCALAMVAVSAAQAQSEPSFRAETRTVERLWFAGRARDVRVDGSLDEWPLDARPIRINVQTAWLSPAPVVSDADASAEVWFLWDEEHLYLAARVQDQSLTSLRKPEDMPWTCDSLMLSLTVVGATRASERYAETRNVETSSEPFFGFSYHDGTFAPRRWTPNSRYAVQATDTGYVIEAAIAARDIGYAPRSGDRYKIAFILSDHDADGKFAQLLAGHRRGGTSRDWYELRLRDERPYAGEMISVDPAVSPGKPLAVAGQIDVFENGLRLESLRIRDRAGNVPASLDVGKPLTPGLQTVFSAVFPGLDLPPETYEAVAVVAAGERVFNGAVQTAFRIVSASEARAGMDGRLPDRHIVPDPTRYAFPSDPRRYRVEPVDKRSYIGLVRKVAEHHKDLYARGRAADAGQHGPYYAFPAYALFRHTGELHYLETVLGLMQHAHEAHGRGVLTPHWIVLDKFAGMLLEDAAVSGTDREWLREFTPRIIEEVWKQSRPTEWGAFNRALLWGGLLDIAARKLPDHPDAARWREYADLQWDSWWPYRDHDENASDYNASSMMDYLDWAEFRDPEHLNDPGIRQWLERQMYQVTPSGGFPGYGDSSPWNASAWHWIPVFERMATITRDGRFKWAAHRLFEYSTQQIDDLFSYHAVYDGAAAGCAWAYLYADEEVAAQAPEMQSRVLQRKRVVWVDDAFRAEMLERYNIQGLFFRLEDDWMPDKLILRAGSDRFAPCGMLELCPDAGHHMSTVPNFNNLMHRRAVLLTDLGYFEKGPEYHNVVHIEDLTGIAETVPGEVVAVPVFDAGRRATYASVQVENYKGWPVLNDRRVLFTDTGLVAVKDLLYFRKLFAARVRQQWQTRNLASAGGHWANVNIPFILHTGLGLGRGVSRYLNPAWDLLIYFTPQDGRDYEVHDRSLENVWQAVPLRISQRYRGLPPRDEPLHFTTLLWPHEPTPDAAHYAERVEVLADDPLLTVFRVELTDTQRLYLGINDTGAEIEAGSLATDAHAFVLECAREDDRLTPRYLWARRATGMRLEGRVLHETEEASHADRAF